MQIVSFGDNLHVMSNPVFWKSKKNISICPLQKISPGIFPRKQDLTLNANHLLWKQNLHEMSNPVFWEKKEKKIF